MIVSLFHTLNALSFALVSIPTLALTAVSITRFTTKQRSINVVLFLTNNQLNELPLITLAILWTMSYWLRITGTFSTSVLATICWYFNVLTTIGLGYLFSQSLVVKDVAQKFLDQLAKESKTSVQLPEPFSAPFLQKYLNPLIKTENYTSYENISYWTPQEQLEVIRNDGWESAVEMVLDVYQPNGIQGGDERPVLFYIHGGGWTSGTKDWLGPYLPELLSRSWIVVSIDHRLQPKAGYPSQLIDCKRALRWVKEEIRILGGNPDNIVVMGDSSGGHLAAMLTLTMNDPTFQPGFESVDTTVHGCVSLSGVLDLVDAKGQLRHNGRERFTEVVAKRSGPPESEENIKFMKEHSPFHLIKPTGVPFLVVHGDQDILQNVRNARDFVEAYRAKIPGGDHCFNGYSSLRSWYTTLALVEWLQWHFGASQNKDKKARATVDKLVDWGW
ncbi:hypothetical protein BGW38_002216 [Lunasporangiospora selenospora]|uniref:BD-FAE-like domain-containing protein n=1 Tax=Lunasporangiospora selenospora TaxID=979761 RepID=A0A9P6KI64_9FUNG|nr:hypothetical protein BGW38_002216 [Lunasporangiospora selenospora]